MTAKRRGMMARVGLALLAALLVRPGPAGADAARVQVAPRVEVNAVDLTLGDLAVVETEDADLQARLAALVIGRAPLAGQERVITRDYVELRLRQGGLADGGVALVMPERVAVQRGSVRVAPEEIEALVVDWVRERHPFGAEAGIREVVVPDAVVLPKGERQCLIEGPVTAAPARTLPLQVTFVVNGETQRRLHVTVRLEIFREVVVAAAPIARRQVIGAADLTTRRLDLTELPGDVLLDPAAVVGQWARTGIAAGRVIRQEQVEFPPAVQQGDRVLIVAEGAGLRVTAMGEVRDAGRPGDSVAVVNLDSRKTVYARVLDARTVRVDF